jgi:hypothetical protein
MTIEIKKTDGRWLINGKTYDKLNAEEKDFFDKFILYMKDQFENEKKH